MNRIPVWKRTHSSPGAYWNHLLKALQKHKAFVTIFSAFIVFASFIVKDAWDDHLKELANAIKSAEESMKHKDEQVALARAFEGIRRGLNLLLANAMGEKTPGNIQSKPMLIVDQRSETAS